MTPFEQFLQFLRSVGPSLTIWFLFKIMFVVALTIYLAFAIIIIRQTYLMTKTLVGNFTAPIKLIAWIHLGVAAGILFLALTTI